jgi:hypothetical protein
MSRERGRRWRRRRRREEEGGPIMVDNGGCWEVQI